ncbi:unnamed protein product [Closterium sp. Yama58-4]|nr:unnamed protein product [Closterium sp. Yama58-4]
MFAYMTNLAKKKIEILPASKPIGADSLKKVNHTAVRVCSCRPFLTARFPFPPATIPPSSRHASPSRARRAAISSRPFPHSPHANPPFHHGDALHFPLPSPSFPPPVAFTSPSRRLHFPSRRLHFPLPSPSLPPPVAFTSPSRRLHFPLPSPSLSPPVAFTSPSRRLHFPLPSPSLPPPVAFPSPPVAFTSPSRRLHFPLPSPSLPSPIALAPPSHRPLFPGSPCFACSFASPGSLCPPPLLLLTPLSPQIPYPLFLKLLVHLRQRLQHQCSPFSHSHHRLSTPPPPLLLQSLVHLRHL